MGSPCDPRRRLHGRDPRERLRRRRAAARESRRCARDRRSGRRRSPTRSARPSSTDLETLSSPIRRSTPSTSACRRPCTARPPSERSPPESTCCSRSRWRSPSRTPRRSSRRRSSGRTFMVGLVLRFFAEYVEIERRVASARSAPCGLSARTGSRSPPTGRTGSAIRSRPGGTPVDLMVHDFDQLNLLLGEPRSVYAARPHRPERVTSSRSSSTSAAPGSRREHADAALLPFSAGIRVLGEQGVPSTVSGRARGGRRQHRLGRPELPAAAPERTASRRRSPSERTDPWGAEIAYFVDCVEAGAPVERGTGEQALVALRVSLAANRSLASGRLEAVW